MSAQFGVWNFDGEPPSRAYIEKADSLLLPYGPDGGGSYSDSGIAIRYREFQPHHKGISRRSAASHLAFGRCGHLGWPPRQSFRTDR